MSLVKYEVENYIGRITLNRPDVVNCFNYNLLIELEKIIDEICLDEQVRVIIFTGEGEKAFSAGADLKERKFLSDREVKRNVQKISDVFHSINNMPQITIAAVNGYALGAGFELMLACDFRIAVEEAKMGLPEVSWAIIPGAGGTQLLPRLIGEQRAKELIFTGKTISANQAKEYGILSYVVQRSELYSKCNDLATKISTNAPKSLVQAKFAINKGVNVDLETGLAIEKKAYEITIPTKDRKEALLAFKEKRKPHFIGK